jgi:hypothetical protein
MNSPLSPDQSPCPEELPLRHRPTREREAEQIRQDFIRSQRKTMYPGTGPHAQEFSDNEP